VSKDIEALALRVHDVAEKSRPQRDTGQWAAAYGELLTTCASCHQALGVAAKKIGRN
jgi:predicted CxxxxCH...CXXCH cytochrome family protein